jgi:hypothetical protein
VLSGLSLVEEHPLVQIEFDARADKITDWRRAHLPSIDPRNCTLRKDKSKTSEWSRAGQTYSASVLVQIPVTYAGGARSLADLEVVKAAGNGRVDVTVGSALDIFGGDLPYRDVVEWHREQLR